MNLEASVCPVCRAPLPPTAGATICAYCGQHLVPTREPSPDREIEASVALLPIVPVLARMGDAEAQLVPAKHRDRRVIVADFGRDPNVDGPNVASVASGVAMHLMQSVQLLTDVTAESAVLVAPGAGLVGFAGPPPAELLAHAAAQRPEGHVVLVSGTFTPPNRVAVQLHGRQLGSPAATFEASLEDVAERLLDWLVANGWGQRVRGAAGFDARTGADPTGYLASLNELLVQLLADPVNGFVPPLPAGSFAVVRAHLEPHLDDATLQGRLAYLASSILAHRSGHLSEAQRQRALALSGSLRARSEPLGGLADAVDEALSTRPEAANA